MQNGARLARLWPNFVRGDASACLRAQPPLKMRTDPLLSRTTGRHLIAAPTEGALTQSAPITNWPVATRERLVAAIIDAALPTCAYRFERRDETWAVEPISELPQQYIEPPDDAVLDFLVDRLSPALAVLKTIYGMDEAPASNSLCDEAVAALERRTRNPSIARQIKQAEKTGKTVTSIVTAGARVDEVIE
jgi:hypothetical protein